MDGFQLANVVTNQYEMPVIMLTAKGIKIDLQPVTVYADRSLLMNAWENVFLKDSQEML